MTIYDVFNRLYRINRTVVPLLWDTGFHSGGCLGDHICPIPDVYEDNFLRERAETILGALGQASSELSYLAKPPSREHILEKLPGGRYGYHDDGGIRVFTCGDCLEAKLCDEHGKPRWSASRIESDASGYFLMGFHSIPLSGLTVRERR